MCTVVVRLQPSEPARILAVRDEFVSRTFDDPGAWWPGEPDVIGGRDRLAGGTWCATDVAAGRTALVLNRRERQTGKPSRGVLPLTALQHGTEWPAHLDHRDMASFTLVLADHDTVTAWTWDAVELRRVDLAPGTHVFTARGIDPDDRKTARYARRFAGSEDWRDLVTAEEPHDDESALLVRHPFETDTFATVLAQLITATPGDLRVIYSRTPWQAQGWSDESWSSDGLRTSSVRSRTRP